MFDIQFLRTVGNLMGPGAGPPPPAGPALPAADTGLSGADEVNNNNNNNAPPGPAPGTPGPAPRGLTAITRPGVGNLPGELDLLGLSSLYSI
jgi:hypothetical protein